MTKYYITTTLPYVNSDPHIGFAMEIVRADVLARLYRDLGDEVMFNTGTDEHGQKIYQKAIENKETPIAYCNRYAEKFKQLKSKLNLSYDRFTRTTDEHHIAAAQEFWKKCLANGDIYKKTYQTKYCVGCELEKTDSDLVEGKCPDHPNQVLELRDEENYFFRFSKYQNQLLDLYRSNPNFVEPDFRMKEMMNFVESGLQDFSISRLKEKMPWGIEVPGDTTQVMYVWFDALVNYVSALGFPEGMNGFWPGVQVCGKDNLRQQSAMWQAMLMSAGLPNSKKIYVNGFILSGGQKMSKSLGNTIDPLEWIEKYGTDAVRYFLLSSLSSFEDSDVTTERFVEIYTSDLVNGIGNLAARVAAMAEGEDFDEENKSLKMDEKIVSFIKSYEFAEAVGVIKNEIKKADGIINEKKVWTLKDEEKTEVLRYLVEMIRQLSVDLRILLPETAEKIAKQYNQRRIEKSDHLFARIK